MKIIKFIYHVNFISYKNNRNLTPRKSRQRRSVTSLPLHAPSIDYSGKGGLVLTLIFRMIVRIRYALSMIIETMGWCKLIMTWVRALDSVIVSL